MMIDLDTHTHNSLDIPVIFPPANGGFNASNAKFCHLSSAGLVTSPLVVVKSNVMKLRPWRWGKKCQPVEPIQLFPTRHHDDDLEVHFEGGMSPPHVGTVLQMTGLKEFQRENKAMGNQGPLRQLQLAPWFFSIQGLLCVSEYMANMWTY